MSNPSVIGVRRCLYFDPEDIHIMRLNESEEDFDARLEQYEDTEEEEGAANEE